MSPRFLGPLVLLFGLAVAGRPVEAGAAAPPSLPRIERVAVVDVQRCIIETAEGKRAKKDLEETFAKSQARIDRKAQSLRQQAADLQAKASMLAQDELVRRQEVLMRGENELQTLGAESQQEIQRKETELTEVIYKRVQAIVKQIALEEAAQLVLVRSAQTMLFANPQLDVTNHVILAYDKRHP